MYLLKVPESWWQGDNGSTDRKLELGASFLAHLKLPKKSASLIKIEKRLVLWNLFVVF